MMKVHTVLSKSRIEHTQRKREITTFGCVIGRIVEQTANNLGYARCVREHIKQDLGYGR